MFILTVKRVLVINPARTYLLSRSASHIDLLTEDLDKGDALGSEKNGDFENR